MVNKMSDIAMSSADQAVCLRQKDETIRELRAALAIKDARIQDLNRQLDKCKSVLVPMSPTLAPRKQRTQGISAEPRDMRSLLELSTTNLRKFNKSTSLVQRVAPRHSVRHYVRDVVGDPARDFLCDHINDFVSDLKSDFGI